MAFRNIARPDVVAVYDTTEGDAPLADPVGKIRRVRAHTGLDFLRGAIVVTATVNHAAVAGVTGTGAIGAPPTETGVSGSAQPIADGQVVTAAHLLHAHGLGSTPRYAVFYNDEPVTGATIVQAAGGGIRLVSSYADAAGIYLFEVGASSANTLPAASRSYKVAIFKDPAANPALPALLLSPGRAVLARGKVDTNDQMLRIADAGEAALLWPKGPSTDIGNGGIRSVNGAGSVVDYNGYAGPFAGPGSIGLALGPAPGAGPGVSFKMEPGRSYGQRGGSLYYDTGLPMVRFFPAAYDLNWSGTIGFPEPPHDNAYAYARGMIGGSLYGGCASYVTLLNQEWEDVALLGTVPAGTDLIYVETNLTRTVVPSQINGITIPVLFAQGKAVGLASGTLHVEMFGILQRKIDVFLSGTGVYLRRKQSIKDTTYTFWRYDNSPTQSGWTYGSSRKGHIVSQIQSIGPNWDPSGYNYSRASGYGCSLSDPTAYASTYAGTIKVRAARYQT